MVAASVAAVALPQSAHACRVFLTPKQRIANAYADNAELQVAIVRITGARHLSFPQPSSGIARKGEAPWRATASVTKILVGDRSPELVVFDRNWGRSTCDDGTTMPKEGNEWVVYYLSTYQGRVNILESYPSNVAKSGDIRLSGNVR
jgi:hypothetical protein